MLILTVSIGDFGRTNSQNVRVKSYSLRKIVVIKRHRLTGKRTCAVPHETGPKSTLYLNGP